MKEKKNKQLTGEPQILSENAWYYEEKKGIMLIHEIREGVRYIRTDQILIPWKKLEATMRRYEGKK